MFRDLILRTRSLLRRNTVEREMDQEFRFHLDMEIAKNKATGMSTEEATRAAMLSFGGIEQMKEDNRDARGVSLLETTLRDLRYAFRVLRQSPAFTAVAVLSLALGVGANTAIFQLVDAIRLRALPVSNPQELAEIRIADMSGARGGQQRENAVTYPIWEQVRKSQTAFSGVFAWTDAEFNLSPKGEVRSVPGLWVSGEFFDVLGVRPVIGRLFTPEDDRRGCSAPGAVISYSFWQSEFGGDPAVIGRRLTISGHSIGVLGVTPAGFFGLDVGREFQVVLPICAITEVRGFNALDAGTFWWLSVLGRLRPGVSLAQASAQLNSISPGIFQTTLPSNYPSVSVQNYLQMRLTADSAAKGISGLRSRYSELLWILLAISGTVLLNACANLANLMLARAGSREKEIAVRLAIGGSPRRIVQQLLIESALIAALGGGAALFASQWLSRGLLALLTAKESWITLDLHTDWRVLSFTFGVATLTCLIFGLAPALRAAQSKPVEALKSGSRSLTAGQATLRMRRMLIASQVALSLVLLVGSLLFVRSLQNLIHAEPGFRTKGLFVAVLGYPQQVATLAWQQALLDHLRGVPGVTAVADTSIVPLAGNSTSNRVWMDGKDFRDATNRNWSKVSPGYFRTLDIPLLAGRDFDDHDGPAAPKVAIVNEAFAKEVAHTVNPVGIKFRIEATPSTPETIFEIVGLVKNTKYGDIREPMRGLFYAALSQDPRPSLADQILIHSALPAQAVLPAIRKAILEAHSDAHFEIYEFSDLMQGGLARERLMATLSSMFAGLAALLSAVGLYGVITYIVTRRRTEIGIRIALGANRASILNMLFRESGRMLLAGIAAGALLTLALATLVRQWLFELKPYDPWSMGAAISILLLVGLLATFVPAFRAAGIDPTAALRED